jgi:hypothetical protein
MPARKKRGLRQPQWHAVRIETTPGLYRLVGPLARQTGRKKALCVAIGGKRLKAVVDALNAAELEV